MSDKNKATPRKEEIQRRAFETYSARGRADGKDLDDWLTAERELMDENDDNQKTRKATVSQGQHTLVSQADSKTHVAGTSRSH